MSISPGWTDQRIREFVYTYESLPRGSKRDWLKAQGISKNRFYRWRNTVFDGDLNQGLIPREGGVLTSPGRRRDIVKFHVGHDNQQELDRLSKRVQELEASNEALGKAIGLLHQLNAQEPDERPVSETNLPTTSSLPRTSS